MGGCLFVSSFYQSNHKMAMTQDNDTGGIHAGMLSKEMTQKPNSKVESEHGIGDDI